MKLISADTCHEAQLFLVARLRDMSPNQQSQLTADAIRAGIGLPLGNTRTWDPFEVIGHVTKFLERHEVEYFLGGSLASSVYGEPRFTQDADVVARLADVDSTTLAQGFGPEFHTNAGLIQRALVQGVSATLTHRETGFKIDLIPSRESPFERAAFQRKSRVSLGRHQVDICSPEDIILTKIVWYQKRRGLRDQHLRDIQMVLMVQKRLDLRHLLLWADHLGVGKLLGQFLEDAGLCPSALADPLTQRILQ